MTQAENQAAQHTWARREREWVRRAARAAGGKIQEPVLLLSAGHGGADPGAVSDGYREKDITTALAWATLAQWAKYDNPPGQILAIDEPNLPEVINEVNKRYGALGERGFPVWALEIHVNSGPQTARGAEVVHYPNNLVAKEIGEILLRKITGPSWPNRGLKTPIKLGRGPLAWIDDTSMSALILEVGFITNLADRETLTGPRLYAKARQLAAGIHEAQLYVQAWFEGNTSDAGQRRG